MFTSRLVSRSFSPTRHTTNYLGSGPAAGPLMIFLHGWPEFSLVWRAQMDAFAAEGWHCVAPDMRGYGGSSAPAANDAYTIEQVVADMAELHGDLGGKPAIWVGPAAEIAGVVDTSVQACVLPGNALLPSQTDAALDMIRSRIVDMTLQPGSRIDERLLIDQFRLGRTPAREAINRLVAEGFVHILPQRGGTFVRKLDLDEMGEVIMAHQLAESVLGQMCRFDDPRLLADLEAIQQRYVVVVNRCEFLAITQLNQDFHLRLHQTIGNALVYSFAESTHRHVRRLNVYVYQREQADRDYQSAQFAANLDQHEQIISAISHHDRDALAELLPAHAKHTQRRLVRLLENKSAGPAKLNLTSIAAALPTSK